MKNLKKIKKYNKGFTLVEMITTITILGVVSLIALPVISNVSSGFTTQKFENYEEALITATKLYVDQNHDDIFGYSDDGCTDIGFSELNSKSLIEDIDVEGATCADSSTYVRVTKNGTSYNYDVSIKCTLDGATAYEKTIAADNTCLPIGRDDPDNPDSPSGAYVPMATAFDTDPKIIEEPTKSAEITILVSDEKGFAPNAKIRYWWINSSNGDAIIGEKKEKQFTNALIRSSHTLRLKVNTPSGVTGDLKLVVEPVSVQNSDGRQVTGRFTSQIFRIDNTPPVVKIKASYFDDNKVGSFVKEVNNTDLVISEWKNNGYYFDFTGTTDNYSGYSFSKQTWKWNKTGNYNLVEDYAGGSENNNVITNKTFTGRGARFGTVTICDHAGNCTSKNVKVNISTVYYINFDGNGASGGSVGKATCYYGVDCKLPNNGFSRTGHSFSKWQINGGEYDQGANVKNLVQQHEGSVTAKVKWNVNYYTVYYHVNDSRGYNGNYDARSVAYGAGIPTDPNPQWSINEFRQFNGWNNNPGTMPAHDITLEASISDVYCQVVSGHMTYDHVATFVPVFQAAGWSNVTIQHAYEPFQQYYQVVTSYNLTYQQAVNVAQYVWDHTPSSGPGYLVWMMYGCLNGRSYSMCRNWAC